MENVILLNRYRHKQKKAWLSKHGPRLDHFIDSFIHQNFNVDFKLVSDTYFQDRQIAMCGDSSITVNELAWDYHDLREVLETAIADAFGEILWQDLSKQYWYDSRCFSRDEVLDRLLTRFILGAPAKALKEK